jgi:photosystem II stability/assembly factor-like uncharacterized protein
MRPAALLLLALVGRAAADVTPPETGARWAVVRRPTEAFYGVWGSSSSNVYVVGSSGTIIRTTDGGRSWYPELSGQPETDLRDVWGSGAGDVYAVGDHGVILHSSGHGDWTLRRTGAEGRLDGMWGSGPDDLYVVGQGAVVLHSSDGGWRWRRQIVGGEPNLELYDVWGSGRGRAIVVGSLGFIATTRDGEHWQQRKSPAAAIWKGVTGDGRGRAWAVDLVGRVISSDDDGATWRYDTRSTDNALFGVFWDGRSVQAAGWNGTVLHRNKGTWVAETSSSQDDLNRIWGTGPSDLYAVGWKGTILHHVGITKQ